MCRLAAIAFTILLGWQAALAEAPAPPAQSFAPLIEKTAPAVVNIYARKIVQTRSATRFLDGSAFWRLFRDTLLFGYGRDRIENSLGSGVIVRPDGVIVTNTHVVENADGIFVALVDSRAYAAEVLLSDKRTDLTVLRIAAGEPLPFIEFADSDRLKVGDPVIAIGNPFGLGQTVTSGIVSAVARTSFGIGDFRFFIQTDAAINPGNSGGAQITMEGKLSGINTAIFTTSGGSQGLGFAIPSNMVRIVVESAVQGKPLVRPWIGVSGRSLSPLTAAMLGLASTRGVLVTETYEGGPGQIAGLRFGDVILTVDDFPVDDPQALRYRIATQQAGGSVLLQVMRQGRRTELAVTLLPPPGVPPRNETRLPPLNPLRGAKVASLSPAFAEELSLDSGLSGVVVLEVGRASAAGRLGLEAGDIIRGLDGRAIRTVEDVLAYRIRPFKPWTFAITRAGREIAIAKPPAASLIQ
ncbi:MAG: trypsin-like peptidase domain-containing protein [Hyphomicrobiales bacterium]